MIGHNSAGGQDLADFVARIEALEDQKDGIANEIKAQYAAAKASGFDPKIMRQVIKLRKEDEVKRLEREAEIERYMLALGMLADTPLGQSAIEHAAE